MRIKLLLAALLVCLSVAWLPAQSIVAEANITAADTGGCAVAAGCVSAAIPSGSAVALLRISERVAFTGTLAFEAHTGQDWIDIYGVVQPDNGTQTYAKGATAAGTWRIPIAGYRALRVRCTAYTEGSLKTTIQTSSASAAY